MSDPTLFETDTRKPWQGGPDPNTLARRSDPETSHLAARALDGGTMRRRLLEAFAVALDTAEGAAARAGYSPADGAWKRVSDLLNLGFLEDTGARWVGVRSGRPQRVLRITEAGREALR